MKKITLYCDGSSLGNPGFGGWGVILNYQGTRKILSGGEANTTNNRMELIAVIEGLKALREPCDVKIISDSKYVCNGINLWLKNWIIKDFKKVKNPDLWREYENLSKKHKIIAVWVKGHNGHKENEECDKIAKIEAEKIKNSTLDIYDSELSENHNKSNVNYGNDLFDLHYMQTTKQKPLESKKSIKQKKTKGDKKNTDTLKSKCPNDYCALQTRIDYYFNDKTLLLTALTHKSFDKHKNNERLEFLGDAVLDLIIGEYVFRHLEQCNEGDLTKIRAAIVNENSFANLANALELGKYIFISSSESRNDGRKKPSILSDAFEALIGAIYIDGGLEGAKKVALNVLEYVYKDVELKSLFIDYKTALQELTQAICGDLPEYILLDTSGPDHNKSFTMQVRINAQEFAIAKGKSKKEAEQICAKIAYNRIKCRQNEQFKGIE